MASSEILTIGSAIKYRGEYNTSTTYYMNNQVTMYGCIFQALSTNFSGIPPLTVASDKTISLTNTTIWRCVINNVDLYNATLSTNNINSRVTKIENNIDNINTTAQTANSTAQTAKTYATSALNTANATKQDLANLSQTVDEHQIRIQENAAAIKALQNKTSSLEIVCTIKTIAYEPDDSGNMAITIPLYIYNNGTEITDKATVKTTFYTPVQTGISSTWDKGKVEATVYVPGKHVLIIEAEYEGVTTTSTIDIYITLPITITMATGDIEVKLATVTATELPVSLSVTKTGRDASELLFNIPSYLKASKISCSGIDVPITDSQEEKDNYDILCTAEEIIAGTFDFTIQ